MLLTHDPDPLENEHARPHMPQWLVSLVRLRHPAPEQAVRPEPQTVPQVLDAQT